jgi:hypothetical protein
VLAVASLGLALIASVGCATSPTITSGATTIQTGSSLTFTAPAGASVERPAAESWRGMIRVVPKDSAWQATFTSSDHVGEGLAGFTLLGGTGTSSFYQVQAWANDVTHEIVVYTESVGMAQVKVTITPQPGRSFETTGLPLVREVWRVLKVRGATLP